IESKDAARTQQISLELMTKFSAAPWVVAVRQLLKVSEQAAVFAQQQQMRQQEPTAPGYPSGRPGQANMKPPLGMPQQQPPYGGPPTQPGFGGQTQQGPPQQQQYYANQQQYGQPPRGGPPRPY
ncbi:hypothetical protein HK098_005383, partial [Nowakowskiella sp. JEL0407]